MNIEPIPQEDEISIMPEDEGMVLDELDQYLLKLLDQLESEA